MRNKYCETVIMFPMFHNLGQVKRNIYVFISRKKIWKNEI